MGDNTDSVHSAKELHGAVHGLAKPEHADFHSETPPESPTPRVLSREQPMPSISRLLKGKEHEWKVVTAKPGPLHLLDLPVEVLRLVTKEVSGNSFPNPSHPVSNPMRADHPYQRPDGARAHLQHAL